MAGRLRSHREFAHAFGVSRSSLIEASSKKIAAEDAPSFASRRRGRFEAARWDDARYEALARKYL